MKTTDEEIDNLIKKALNEEEASYYEKLGEQNIIEMSLGVFQGKNKVIYIIAVMMSFILFGVFVYCAVKFYSTDDMKEMMLFGGIGFWCMIGVMGIKIWHWMQMNTNRILRELKRLEIQLASKK